jgi:hypothetical protein
MRLQPRVCFLCSREQITTVYNTIGSTQNSTLQSFALRDVVINSISADLNLTRVSTSNISSITAAQIA